MIWRRKTSSSFVYASFMMKLKSPNRVFHDIICYLIREAGCGLLCDCVAADICFCASVRSVLSKPLVSWHESSAAFVFKFMRFFSCCHAIVLLQDKALYQVLWIWRWSEEDRCSESKLYLLLAWKGQRGFINLVS